MQSLVVLMFLGLARPPLTQAQVGQLETATDHTRALDEPALYPLLNNAVKWQASDELGAIIPDFCEMLRSPAIYRGKVFLIEGQLAGKPRPIQRLSRPGAWDRRLEQWGVGRHRFGRCGDSALPSGAPIGYGRPMGSFPRSVL